MSLLPASSGLLIHRSVVAHLAATETVFQAPLEEVMPCAVLHGYRTMCRLTRWNTTSF